MNNINLGVCSTKNSEWICSGCGNTFCENCFDATHKPEDGKDKHTKTRIVIQHRRKTKTDSVANPVNKKADTPTVITTNSKPVIRSPESTGISSSNKIITTKDLLIPQQSKKSIWGALKKQDIPYDLIFRIDSLPGAISRGWEIITSAELKAEPIFEGAVVGVLGRYNQGKTFLLQKLTRMQLGISSDFYSTEGLSFKFFSTEEDTLQHVIMDTSGLNTPISLGNEKFEESSQPFIEQRRLEEFLGDLIVELSDYVLVVVTDITWQDQEFIWKVAQRRYKKRMEKYAETWVVHNLRNLRDPKLFVQKQEVIASLFGASLLTKGSESFYYSEKFMTRHAFLMNEEAGSKHNSIIYGMLRKWISSIVVKRGTVATTQNAFENVRMAIDSCLRNSVNYVPYLSSVEFMDNRIFLKVSDDDKKRLIKQTSGLFVPNYRLQMDETQYTIHLFVPIISADQLDIEQVDDELAGHFSINVSGTIPEIEGTCDVNQIPFGNFSIKFNIPTTYYTGELPQVSNENGLIIITFKAAKRLLIKKKNL